MPRYVLFLLLSGALLATGAMEAQDTTHWVGGSGEWSDPAHWSTGIPGRDDIVSIVSATGELNIHLNDDEAVRGMHVDGTHGGVTISGGQGRLRVNGDLELRGNVNWLYTGTLDMTARQGIAELDLRGIPVAGDMRFTGGGTWSMKSDLVLADDRVMELRAGTLVTNGSMLRAGTLRFTSHQDKRLMAGSSVVLLTNAFDPGPVPDVIDPGTSRLIVNGALVPWGTGAVHPGADDERAVNVCGTGPGQTLFTIDAELLSNYNGFGVSCHGVCDGSVNVTVTGGIGPFTYNWVGGPTTATWNNVCSGNQIVIVTDQGQGVSCATTVQVTDPALLSVFFFGNQPPTCASVCNGVSNAFAVGGVPTYEYSWNNGAGTGASFNALCPGSNTLHVTDANMCAFDTTFIFPVLPISPNLTSLDANCFGACDGSASVAPTGGTGSYLYDWGPGTPVGDGTNSVSQLCAGSYTVTVIDANGCDTTIQFQIASPPPILPNATHTNATCSSSCDGTATVAPTGAAGPFSFNWSPAPGGGQGTATATGLCAGIYHVTITDTGSGCDTVVAFTITAPTPIQPNGIHTNDLCAASCDGTATVTPSGGTPGYTYAWSPAPPIGQGTPQAAQLCAGAWAVTITDAAGCDTTVQFTITAPPPIIPNDAQTDVDCAGACDGTATVAPTGGTGAFSYVWNPAPPAGQGTPTASQLCPGPWSVLITDANGCDTTIQFTITEPLPLASVDSQTDVTCGGLCDGTASVLVSGGVPGYTYTWSPVPAGGQGTANATGLCPGTWSVTITDAHGCILVEDFDIQDAVPIDISLAITPASCPFVCDGMAGVIATGGVPAYTYVWSPAPGGGQGTPNVTGLCPQAWSLTVGDALGCDTTVSFTIAAPAVIIPNATITDVNCFGNCDGSIMLAPTGGSGAFTYAWSPVPPNGDGAAQATGLCAGSYQVTIGSGACDTTVSFTIAQPSAIDVSLATDPTSCAASCDGSASVSISGGTPGYVLTWTPAPAAGQGTANPTGFCPGPHTLTIADAAGCDTVIAFTIDAPTPITTDLSTTDVSCNGSCNGSAELIVSGGTPGYTYLWSPAPGSGQGTSAVGGLCPAPYSVTVSDAAGCDTTLQFTIVQPAPFTITSIVTPATCSNECDGSIVLTTAGGTSPYTWTWSPEPGAGQGTATVGGLCPGTWTVTVTDQSACDTTLTIDVGSPAPIDPHGVSTDESCVAACDGTASVAPTGGSGVFSYLWNPAPPAGQGTPSVTGLCPGPWSVTISDSNGCDTTWSFTILPAVPILATISTVDILCWNVCTGEATVNASGGTGVFSYDWNPSPTSGQGTATAIGLCPGPGAVTVTDDAGCDTTLTFEILQDQPIQPNLSVSDESCTGPCSGLADVAPVGGSGGYVYLWQPAPGGGQGTSTATGLCAGTNYTVTITDNNGCDTTVAFIVQPFATIIPNVGSTPASCAGTCDGTVTSSPTGGTGPYSYFWDPVPPSGQGQPAATGLCAGVYQLTIGDVDGCDTTVAITITSPDPVDPGAAVQPITCAGQCTGMITLAPSGGSGGYGYFWSPTPPVGQGTAQASTLCAGDWSVTVTDANGCDTTVTFTLVDPLPLVDSADVLPSHCGLCDGSLVVHASGGSGPYMFTWGPPLNITTPDSVQTGLCAGLYSVIITDASGCTLQQTFAISDEDGEVITVTDGLTSCPGTCDGSVSVAFNCVAAPCTIAWADQMGNDLGQTVDTLSSLCAGEYFASVTNGVGCISIAPAEVLSPPSLVGNISSSPVTCNGNCDGMATIGLSGGSGPFTITWSPEPGAGQGTPHVTGLCPGPYDIAVGYLGGCDANFSVLITTPLTLSVTPTVSEISCSGQCDGAIALDVQGGTGMFSYNWSPAPPVGQGTSTASGLCPGDYVVTVSDLNGCDTTLDLTLTDPEPLTVDGSSTSSHCAVCDGSATLVVTGGTGPVDIEWTDAAGNPVGTGLSLSDLCAGIYIAQVTDAHGCSVQQVFAITDADGEDLTMTDGQTICANACDGQISVAYVCSNAPCTVSWFDVDANLLAQGPDTLSGLCPGTYLVQVVAGNGCMSIDTAAVVPTQVIVPNLSSTGVSCGGTCDGSATVAPTGGVGPYTYLWSPEPGSGQGTPQATGLCAGTYSVAIVDATGCDTTVNAMIVAPPPLAVLAQLSDVTCNGACDGGIAISASGGGGSFSYDWSPAPPSGQGTSSVTGLCAGDWSVTITDVTGCDSTITYSIAEPPPLSITFNTVPSSCGVCSGAADAQAVGGTAPYIYTWTDGGAITGTDSMITDLCAGLHTISVIDAHGCTAQAQVPISDIDGEEVTTTDFMLACPDQCDGEVTATFICTVPVCTVAWFDDSATDLGETSSTLSDQCAGLYFVQVTNGLGCISVDSASVIAPEPIVANLSTTPVNCSGDCDGTATVVPTGGAGGFVYAWAPEPGAGQGTSQVTGLCAGTYQVTITDALGCSIVQDVLITSPAPITAAAVVGPITCNAACDGSINVMAQGGTAPLAFQWSPEPPAGQGTSTVTELCAGDWSVTITDDHGCDTTFTITLVDPPVLVVDLTQTADLCFNDCEATAHVDISGGVAPYGITWTDADGAVLAEDTTDVSGLCGGDHVVTVTDAVGCETVVPFTIATGAAIEAGLVFQGESCNGPCDGTASITPSGGSGSGFSILWQPEPPSGQGTSTVTELCAGDWSVTITDDSGCDTTYAFTVLPFAPIDPAAAVQQVTCNGACDGSISLATTGGIAPYTYAWSPEPGTGQGTATADSLCAGDWTVTITDAAGCDTVITYSITEPAMLEVQPGTVTAASCNTVNDGAIDLLVTGGSPDYMFEWAGPGGFSSSDEDLSDLGSGTYTVTATDLNGCQASLDVTVDALNSVIADAGVDQTECSGATITLDGSASQGATTYEWTDDQGAVVGTDTVVALGDLGAGTYTFILNVSDGSCADVDTLLVTILPTPIADAGPDQFVYVEGTVVLGGNPAASPGSSIVWQPDSLIDQPQAPNPSATVNSTTWFVLTTTGTEGCVNVDSVLITVVPQVKVPSGFSPNGDGHNDIWELDFASLFPQLEVDVFNRWGESLFHSVGYAVPWDGRYNGSLVPVGTYYYAIKLHDPRYPDALTGPLTVIR